jgi:hypothetical protein
MLLSVRKEAGEGTTARVTPGTSGRSPRDEKQPWRPYQQENDDAENGRDSAEAAQLTPREVPGCDKDDVLAPALGSDWLTNR